MASYLFSWHIIFSRTDPSNEACDYPRENFLISFPLNRESRLQERGSLTAGVKLIQSIKDGWIHSIQMLYNVGATSVSEQFIFNKNTLKYSQQYAFIHAIIPST